MSLEADRRPGERTAAAEHEGVSARQLRRQKEREIWNVSRTTIRKSLTNLQAYWKFTELDSRGTIVARWRYIFGKYLIDAPATWIRGKLMNERVLANRVFRKLGRAAPRQVQTALLPTASVARARD
jgi:hypothetical protein